MRDSLDAIRTRVEERQHRQSKADNNSQKKRKHQSQQLANSESDIGHTPGGEWHIIVALDEAKHNIGFSREERQQAGHNQHCKKIVSCVRTTLLRIKGMCAHHGSRCLTSASSCLVSSNA